MTKNANIPPTDGDRRSKSGYEKHNVLQIAENTSRQVNTTKLSNPNKAATKIQQPSRTGSDEMSNTTDRIDDLHNQMDAKWQDALARSDGIRKESDAKWQDALARSDKFREESDAKFNAAHKEHREDMKDIKDGIREDFSAFRVEINTRVHWLIGMFVIIALGLAGIYFK